MEDALKISKNALDICQKTLLVKEFSLEEYKKSLKKKGEFFFKYLGLIKDAYEEESCFGGGEGNLSRKSFPVGGD